MASGTPPQNNATTAAPAALGVPPPWGSQLWFAEKLSRKKETLTRALLTVAGARLLWITRGLRRWPPPKVPTPVTAFAPQLVVWTIFWPTALVVLRTGGRWADRVLERAGWGASTRAGVPTDPDDRWRRPLRPEVDGDARKDL
jgi:hypothetical protein